jgi:mRNA interferase MazF
MEEFMLKKGSIIMVDFGPGVGHEQQCHRPALIVTSEGFHRRMGFAWAVPITNQVKGRPDEIPLPLGLKTTGVVLFSQIKMLDLKAREFSFREQVPDRFMDDEVTGRLISVLED